MEECRAADPDLANDLASAGLLKNLHRKSKTRHESKCSKSFEQAGFSCPIEPTFEDVGYKRKHPVLKIKDFLQALALHNKLPILWGGKTAGSRRDLLPRFWRRFRSHDPHHACFEARAGRFDRLLPLQVHADEGETLKKSAVMVINFQSPMGYGLAHQDDSPDAMMVNYVGNSYATRFLYTVCTKKTYRKKNAHVLDRILETLADELADLFTNGVSLSVGGHVETFYVATLGLKGDWPIQARIGHLTRHFGRKGVVRESANSGFCHLCRAGELHYDAFDYSSTAAWRATYLTSTPWSSEGPLCRIPQSARKEFMHKFDLFHTLHKGCFAELAGSAIAQGLVACRRFRKPQFET